MYKTFLSKVTRRHITDLRGENASLEPVSVIDLSAIDSHETLHGLAFPSPQKPLRLDNEKRT